MVLRFKEAEVKSFPANILNDENLLYRWILEEPQKIDISHIYIYSEHIVKKSPNHLESSLTNTEFNVKFHCNKEHANSKFVSITQQQETLPGKLPNPAIGKLAVKVAWEIECKLKRQATANEVIKALQGLVGKEDILIEAIPHGIKWMTTKLKEKDYNIEACGKTLKSWRNSRIEAESRTSKLNLSRI